MESKRLKQRLARLFRASVLLRSPCNHSASTSSSSIFSSTAAGSTSSRCSISTSIAAEPVFLPRNVDTAAVDVPPSLRGNDDASRSLSLSLSMPGRPAGTSPERSLDGEEKERQRRARRNRARRSSCAPMPTSKDYFYHNQAATTKKNVRSKKLLSNGYGFGSSSSDDEGFGLFSSDGEETETFFSSRSFSSDSSEFYNNSKKKKKKKKDMNKLSRRPPMHTRTVADEEKVHDSGSAKSGIPVTKTSWDPYVDFRDSMVEMIVERQIFGAKGLEELLHSYLSLNAAHHHPVILRAFGDISEVLSGQ